MLLFSYNSYISVEHTVVMGVWLSGIWVLETSVITEEDIFPLLEATNK